MERVVECPQDGFLSGAVRSNTPKALEQSKARTPKILALLGMLASRVFFSVS
jgi:hypothetical protein